jgi:phenylalanyl-tRNA synthetase beta chain
VENATFDRRYVGVARYPAVNRDLSLVMSKDIFVGQVEKVMRDKGGKLLESITLFDVYEGDRLPEGKKSYALSFILEDKTQTLNDKTIERTMANLQAAFEKQLGASIR